MTKSMMATAIACALLAVLAFSHTASADIAEFSETLSEWHVRVIRSSEMYGTDDPPSTGSPGNGEAYIRVSGTITVESGRKVTGHLQPFIIEGDTLDYIGSADDKSTGTWYCCDDELVLLGTVPGCTAPNTLVIPPEHADRVFLMPTVNITDASEADFSTEFRVQRSGMYILLFANCDATMFPDTSFAGNETVIWIEGTSVWMNPYGYLPGRLYGFLPFFGWMSVLFALSGAAWLALNVFYWKEVVTVQNFISGMLCVVMIEVATWYFDYRNFNQTGVRHTGVVVFGILTSVCRMTFSRLLVVAVSVGFGVVKPDLGKNKWKLIALGLIYFAFETALELVIRYGQTNSVAQNWRFVLSFPVAILNAITYWWIFFALYRITAQLTVRKQLIKLQLYKRFSSVLVFSMVAAVIFALYQMYYLYESLQTLHWSLIWLLDGGFSLMLYSVVLLSIGLLWRPSNSSHRYAYSQVNRDEMDGEEYGLDGAPTSGGGDGTTEFADMSDKRAPVGPDTMDDEPAPAADANTTAAPAAGAVAVPISAAASGK